MTYVHPGDRLLARAFVASLALHLFLLALIPPLVASGGSQPVETLSFVHVIRLTVAAATPRPAIKIVAKAPAPERVVHIAVAHAPARLRERPRARAIRPASPIAHAPVQAAVPQNGDGSVSVKSPVPVTVPTPAPAVAAAQSVPARSEVGGMLPLGMEEPTPVLDPAVRKALASLGVHVTLRITVDENGHTKAVAFAPPLDSAIENQIRAMLASASWDPAVCGAGMACEAVATIKL